MKGLMIVIALLCIWISSGLYTDYQRESPPFEVTGENTIVKSGYNDIYILKKNDQITMLEVYDQSGERVKVYHIENLKDLYPAATYLRGEVKDEKLYLFYEVGGEIAAKRVVVGARGSLTFMPERN